MQQVKKGGIKMKTILLSYHGLATIIFAVSFFGMIHLTHAGGSTGKVTLINVLDANVLNLST